MQTCVSLRHCVQEKMQVSQKFTDKLRMQKCACERSMLVKTPFEIQCNRTQPLVLILAINFVLLLFDVLILGETKIVVFTVTQPTLSKPVLIIVPILSV